MRLLLCLGVFTLLPLVFAALINVTVDDTLGDPQTGRTIVYTPPTAWNSGPGCSACTANPDAQEAYMNTWHEGTFSKNQGNQPGSVLLASMTFTGSAVHVYCIIALSDQAPMGRSDMSFFLDGHPVGSFSREPSSGDEPFLFNQLVFSMENMPQAEHNLIVQNGHPGGKRSLILLDYITYSYDNESIPLFPSTSESSPTSIAPSESSSPSPVTALAPPANHSVGRIVGGILGTLLGILLFAIVFVMVRRRKRSQRLLPVSGHPDPAPKETSSGWFTDRRAGRVSVYSFNPALLVRKVTHKVSASTLRRPPPLPRMTSAGLTPGVPASPSMQLSSGGPLPEVGVSSLPPSRLQSIQAWQQRTQAEIRHSAQRTQAPVEAPDMSEELSSYYDDNATESRRARTPPPPPPPRRFAVVNL